MKQRTLPLLALSALLLAGCSSVPSSSSAASSSSLSSEQSSQSEASTVSQSALSSESESEATSSSEWISSSQESSSDSEASSSDSEVSSSDGEASSSEQTSSDSSEESSEYSSSEESFSQSSGLHYLDEWTLIDNVSDLNIGDVIVLGVADSGVVAGTTTHGSSGNYFAAESASYDENVFSNLLESSTVFTLIAGSEEGSWKLRSGEGYLGFSAADKIVWDNEKTDWTISIRNSKAYIAPVNVSGVRLLYNASTNRFSAFASASGLVTPSIYRGTIGEKIYPTDFEISSPTNLFVGEEATIGLTYFPETATVFKHSFESSDSSIVSVSSRGVLAGLKQGDAVITARVEQEEGFLEKEFSVHVSNVAVTDVTLSSDEKTISVDKKANLTATVLPDNATDKSLRWSSSDESVATVDDGEVTAVASGDAIITVETIDGGKTASCLIHVVELVEESWTIMMYVCGSDLESSSSAYGSSDVSGYATEDLKEILSVSGQPSDVNIIVETGGANQWRTTSNGGLGIFSNKLSRYHIRDGEFILDTTLSNASMGKSSTFQSFLQWGLTEYSADKTGVILWNHGGALDGVCYDEKYNYDALTLSETQQALAGAFAAVGRTEKLEFIGYDACLMQVQDIAERNADYFNYMVGSEETEIGTGWAYDRWIDDLYDRVDTETLLTEICDSFLEAADYYYDGRSDNDQTMSYLDLSKATAYREAWEDLAEELSGKIVGNSANKNALNTLLKTVKGYADEYVGSQDYYSYVHYYDYPSSWFTQVRIGGSTYYVLHGYYFYGAFDAKDFLNKLAQSNTFNSDKIIAAIEALEDLVAYNIAGGAAGESYGISMICPMTSSFGTYGTEDGVTRFASWRNLVYGLFD